MKLSTTFVAGLPQLDIHTLSEDWALAAALENHWQLLAKSLGLKPSDWIDTQGDRMYGAVMQLSTAFDLDDVIREDDPVVAETEFLSIRKPHALSVTRFKVAGTTKAEVRLLTSFIKRNVKGSNKKFSKVRDLWTAEDHDGHLVDAELERHHAMKNHGAVTRLAMEYEVNRIQDFNTADFLYFKNFVRIAKAAEWRENRGATTRLNRTREVWYYGNVDDGDMIHAFVDRQADACTTVLADAGGRRLCMLVSQAPQVVIAQR